MSDPRAFTRIDREVAEALEFYDDRGWLSRPRGFYGRPDPLTRLTTHTVKGGKPGFYRIDFESGYSPYLGEPGRDRWMTYVANQREYALLLRHPDSRPWLVCVHGTEMGRAALDLTAFRAWELHEHIGLNVLLPVLPRHGRSRWRPRWAG